MSIGDVVLFGNEYDMKPEDCQSKWGFGIIVSRKWNDDVMIWENVVWFVDLDQEVLCDDCDLKKVA